MTNREMKAFKEQVADHKMAEILANTRVPDGVRYIDRMELYFYDGRSCGCDNHFVASGFTVIDGERVSCTSSADDIELADFLKANKECVFISSGVLFIKDDIEEITITTTLLNFARCAKIITQMANVPGITIGDAPLAAEMGASLDNQKPIYTADPYASREGFPTYVKTADGEIGTFRYVQYGNDHGPVYMFPGGQRVADNWEIENGCDDLAVLTGEAKTPRYGLPACYTPETCNPYPLCVGNGKDQCKSCNLYIDFHDEGGVF